MATLNHNRLAEAIKARKIKKANLAKAIGVTPGTLSRYLSGQISPDQPVVLNLCRELSVTVEWLTGKEDEAMVKEEQVSSDTADLISAARDLYSALRFCRSVIETHGIIDASERIAVKKADAALAKADGLERRGAK